MALGKVRTNKRSSSSSSCTSTMTLVAFVALCVLGVWMLTSDTVVPPQTTTRTDTTASTTSTATAAVIDTVLPSASTLEPRSDNKKKDTPSFDDTPGELPEDALGQGDGSTEKGRPRQDSDSQQTNPNESTEGAEEKGTKEKNSVVEEDSHGLRGKESYEEREKQDVSETQVSEESTMTQSQQVEETTEEDPNANHPRNPETEKESGSENPRDAKGEEEEEEGTHARDQTHKLGAKERNKSGNDDSDDQLESAANRQNYEDFHLRRQVSKSGGEAQEHSTGPQTAQIIEEDHANKAQYGKNGDIGPDFPQDHTQRVEPDKSPIQEPKNEEKPGGESNSGGSFPGGGGDSSGIPKESKESQRSWVTQADQSETQKERRKDDGGSADESIYGYTWRLCNVTSGPDYIPCLDNTKAIRKLRSRRHFEHRERHCPEEGPTCLVPIPEGYKKSIKWPTSRDKIWYHNVPNTLLAEVKGHQNWVKVTGEFLTFPGGGTQFIHGALHYIDFLQSSVPKIAWGKNTRVVLDVGCGVASFGGFLFERDVLTMSFAPKDEHEAQVQFALERGIPAISAVMGSKRLPFPSRVFDLVHCARCRVPWHNEGGLLLLELNRVLRPGGYFVWSATPVYQKLEEDVEIWKAMTALTASMCWEVVAIKRDKINSIGAAIYRKPTSNECYNKRKHNRPPMCENDDDPNAAWYVPLQPCMHRVPEDKAERGTHWPMVWPKRLQAPPYWLNSSQMGIYGKPAPEDFATDYEHWKRVVKNMYLNGLGIDWSNIRNAMDMRAVYGGFAAAMKDFKIWILNVVNVNSPDTLPIIYERGLFGIYHDWCESFSTYPRSYDLLHADHLFSRLKKRCKLTPVMAEIDRILRPGGKLIVRDESSVVGEVENLLKSLHWEVHLTFSKNQEGILSAQKGEWRPEESEAASS